jgi:hypothetical protein
MAPPFLASALDRVVSFMLRPLYSRGKSPRYPLDRRLGESQGRRGLCGEKNKLTHVGNGTPAVQPVARRYTG